jgi:hypothetical protein
MLRVDRLASTLLALPPNQLVTISRNCAIGYSCVLGVEDPSEVFSKSPDVIAPQSSPFRAAFTPPICWEGGVPIRKSPAGGNYSIVAKRCVPSAGVFLITSYVIWFRQLNAAALNHV